MNKKFDVYISETSMYKATVLIYNTQLMDTEALEDNILKAAREAISEGKAVLESVDDRQVVEYEEVT